jgi:hypothetical protein
MDVRLRKLASGQDDVVAGWQLREAGWTRAMIEHHAHHRRWQVVHPGVYGLFQAPLGRRQRWIAAALSAPGTVLSHASAAACWGFREWQGSYETVTRPGSGGRRRMGTLLVARSSTLDGQMTHRDGIPIVTAARALIDLAPGLRAGQLGKGFREALRLKTTTANEISRSLSGQRGTAPLVALCDRYATIPYHRCRSDAECRALEVLHDACVEPPKVNVRVAGVEADLVWRSRRLIVEIDGPQFHLFADEDARKQAIWEAAGNTVRRLPSGDVYFRPHRLLALAPTA